MGWVKHGCIPVAGLDSSDEESLPYPWLGFSTEEDERRIANNAYDAQLCRSSGFREVME